MNRSSDHAEVVTLASLLVELTARVVDIAERYDDTPDSAVATSLFTAERQLLSARRAIDRAVGDLA